jgi:hypothetical protein
MPLLAMLGYETTDVGRDTVDASNRKKDVGCEIADASTSTAGDDDA